MKMNRLNLKSKNSKLDFIIYILLGVLFLFDYFISTFKTRNYVTSFLFFLIGFITYIEFVRDKRMFSINKFIMIYLFVFEYIAPYKQYLSNYNVWGLTEFTEEDFLYSSLVVLIFLLSYLFANRVLFKKIKNIKIKVGYNKPNKINAFSLYVLSFISFLCLLYLLSTRQLINLGNGIDSSVGSNTIKIFLIVFIRFIPVASLLYYFCFFKDVRTSLPRISVRIIYILITVVVVLLIYFPLNGTIPRYFLFSVYLMVAFLVMRKTKNRSFILLGILFGFVFIFPAFNFFKYHSIKDISNFTLGGLNFNFYDYDAHQLLMLTIKYCEANGYSYGMNILTGLLSFIPRSIWKSKMMPSGMLIAESFNASFTNLSCPIYAEFYLSFGLIGAVLLTFTLTYFIKLCELKMLRGSLINELINIVIIGLSMYIMRGAFLPAMAYTYGMILAIIFVQVIINICNSFKKRY